jgi:lysozyme family protein
MTFASRLPIILALEGGEVNDPADPGGHTKWGITQGTYAAWLAAQGLPSRSVRDLTPAERDRIYQHNYDTASWAPRCEDAGKPGLALCTFDWGVNAGVVRARHYLQLVIGTHADGLWGPKTRAALLAADDTEATSVYLELRALHYWGRIGDQWCREELVRLGLGSNLVPKVHEPSRKFLNGWLARLRRIARETGAVIAPSFAKGAHLLPRHPH